MTIDEAIEKYKDIANTDANCLRHCMRPCDECVQECGQVAEWLEELKFRRVLQLQCEKEFFAGYENGKKEGYNKAIDDFLEKIQWEYLNGCGIKQSEIEFLVAVSSQVAEQLKAGGDNERK